MIFGCTGNICSGKTFISDVISNYLNKNGITVLRYSMADPVKFLAYDIFNIIKASSELERRFCDISDVLYKFDNYIRLNNLMKIDHDDRMGNVEKFVTSDEFMEFLEGYNDNKMDLSMLKRKSLQYIGTDIGRAYDEDIWANAAKEMIDHIFAKPATCVVIDDIRFLNEVRILSEKYSSGFKVIKSFIDIEEIVDRYPTEITEEDAKKMLEHPSEKEIKDIKHDIVIPQFDDINDRHNRIIELIRHEKYIEKILQY